MTTYILFAAVAALIIGVLIFNIVRSKKIRDNGIEADAVVSRIEESDTISAEGGVDTSYRYYVKYTAKDGQTYEAELNHAPWNTGVGDKLRIKYLPEKPKFAIVIKNKRR